MTIGQRTNVASRIKMLDKTSNEIERNEMNEYHIMLRTVGTAMVSGARTADMLDAEVEAKLAEGWTLFDVQFVGTTAEGYIFAYHFTK